jgi:lipopolysaccharide heptosyltransferase II
MRSWREARRILAIRLDAMGDVLMTTPALRALKALPARPRVTLLTSPAGAAVARLVPEVDDVLVWQAPWMKATARLRPARDRAYLARLRAARFDAAVIFTVYSQSPWPAALIASLAGIPLRLAHGRENPYQLLSDWLPEPEPGLRVRHEVRRQLDLVAAVGARADDERLSLRVPEIAKRRVVRRLAALGVDAARPFVLVHPGASAPSRRYPREAFAAVIDRLAARGWPVVEAVDARASEPPLAAPAASRFVLGTLGELTAIVALASVVLANNSGPAHVAAATGTPVVVLYALTNPQHAPWRVASEVLFQPVPCGFCYKSRCAAGHHACLAAVPPESVVAAVERRLLGSRAAPEQDTSCIELPRLRPEHAA